MPNIHRSAHLATRKSRLAVVVGVALIASSCGGDDDTAATQPQSVETTATPAPTDAPTTDAPADAFPVTFEQMTGPVTVSEKPVRVVTLGYTDTDVANALGAEIVAAVASPFGDDGVNPYWAATPLSAEVASLDVQTPNLEVIAAADPDIILAMGASPSAIELYDELSQIAPMITPTTGPLLDSAEDVTITIGRALGESEAAAQLLADADQAIDDFVAANPQLAGKTAVFAPREGTNTAIFIDESAASVALLRQLGLEAPDEVTSLSGDRIFGATFISDEQIAVIDSADIAIVGLYTDEAREAFLAMPTVASLSVASEGRLIPIDRTLGAALQTPNPVSVHYLLSELGPRIAAAAT